MLNRAVFNLIVALVWALLKGDVNLVNLVWGYVLGAIALLMFRPIKPVDTLTRKAGAFLVLLAVFLWELLKADWWVLKTVLSPNPKTRSGIIALPLELKSDWGITLLGNMITLTPGTITMEVAPDRKFIYVHVIDIENAEDVKRDIKKAFETRIREVFE
ncbi:hypothetical protein SY88_12170 [Clostridiales bacterium PH28_bin88]|nr:hypothetical protein SY88_12170 [Clostridiales bacterium PH28_bin88]